MANRFDEILNECIDQITLRGGTVEECLARYPDLAAELEPDLRVSSRMAQAYAFTPSPNAKANGRQRLHAEYREIQQQDRTRKAGPLSSLTPLLQGWALRWAAAAAVLLLVVLVGGAGIAQASENALPGETLYPVKRAAEQVQLAVRFSHSGKAALHLSHAERRAQEASLLITRGDTSHLEATLKLLRQDLSAVTGVAGPMSGGEGASRLGSRLSDSASQSLALLQESLEVAPEASRQAASNSFVLASQVYGDALESVAARSPESLVIAGMGSIQLWAADPPPPDVEQVLVEIDRIEAHRVSRNNGGWVTITDQPVTFDLLRVAQMRKFLGEQRVESGTYTRVRFSIARVRVVAAGVERPARVPSGYISLTRPFRVAPDQTTVVVLDFDGVQSLRVTGQDRYILTPVARVLAQEPGRSGQRPDPDKEGIPGTPGQGPREAAPKDSGSRPGEIEGHIDSLSSDALVVAGKRIALGPDTETTGKPQPGRKARVEVTVQSDGSLEAAKVEVPAEPRAPDSPPRPDNTGPAGDEEAGGNGAPRSVATEIEGTVQEISEGEWVIQGRRVRVGPDTRINRPAAVGDLARVKGVEQDGGTILAHQITVKPSAKGPGAPENPTLDDRRGGPEDKGPPP